jgi:2-oxoisovalerate dehydrogenase E1 component alpha subunit
MTVTMTTAPQPQNPAVQLLTPEGELVSHESYSLDLTHAQYKFLYREMVAVRRLDQEATALQRQGELGLWASSLGQEAAQVGSAFALEKNDFAFPTYREHGVAWMRGVDPMKIMEVYRGISNGGWDPLEHRCNSYTIVIGNQVLNGVGYAMGCTLDQSDDAAITYFGDGATAQGDVNEGFVFASTFDAPVVFFCQNNQWAISQPSEKFVKTPIYKRADGFGFPGVLVDGNDILAVIAVTKKALDRARSGAGPTLIEAFTYRMGAHTTSDDPTRYRHENDLQNWKLRDPIERLKVMLARNGIADRNFFDAIDTDADAWAHTFRAAVRSMPEPAPDSIFDNVYADSHEALDAQRAAFLDYHEGFADSGVQS